MGFHLALSRADKDAILEAYLAGEKAIVIATRFNVHQTTPGKLAKSKGLPLRQPQNSMRKKMIEITLPMPPSVNELYFNRKPGAVSKAGKPLRGRGKTAAYRAWIEEAGWAIKQQRPEPMMGQVSIILTIEDGPGADVDNTPKAVLDLISKHHGLIEGDSRKYVRALNIAFWDQVKGVKLKVLQFT